MLSKGKSVLKGRKIFLFPVIAILLWLFSFGCDNNGVNAPVEYGSIYVESTPSGATIYLDGVNTGEKTPATLNGVEEGNHQIKITKEGYFDCIRNRYVYGNRINEIFMYMSLSSHPLTIYWEPWYHSEVLVDSAWVPKDSLIQLKALNQNGFQVFDLIWHTSDSTVISIDDSGYVRGLEDWFDNRNRQPEAIVWATKNELTSNKIVVQTVINLTGEWERESDGLETNIRMYTSSFNIGHWYAGSFSPLGALFIKKDSLWVGIPDSTSTWASGHILENGRRVKYTEYTEHGEASYAYIKNSG